MVDAVKVSSSAEEHIRHSLIARGHGVGIRFGVHTAGCSGLAYILEFVDTIDDFDDIIKYEDFVIVIDQKSLLYVAGTYIDYVKDGLNEGFTYLNPQQAAECGCGETFSI